MTANDLRELHRDLEVYGISSARPASVSQDRILRAVQFAADMAELIDDALECENDGGLSDEIADLYVKMTREMVP